MMTNAFIDELAKTIRELFDIEEQQTITSIAINHIISNLEEDLRQEAKIFQLSGNKSLENVLEFIVTKMEGNHLKLKYEPNVAYGSVPTTTNAGKDGDRSDRLEQMVNNIASKLDVIPPPPPPPPLIKVDEIIPYAHFVRKRATKRVDASKRKRVTRAGWSDTSQIL